jgi:hypothetical protein
VGWEAGGFDVVLTCCEVIFSEMYLSLDDGEFVAEVAESVVLTAESFDLGNGIPVIEIGNGALEGVICGGRAIEEGVEPRGEGVGNVLG